MDFLGIFFKTHHIDIELKTIVIETVIEKCKLKLSIQIPKVQ